MQTRARSQACFYRKGKHETTYKYCVRALLDDKNNVLITVDQNDVLGTGMIGTVLGGKTMDGEDVAVKLIPLDVPIPTEDCGLKSDMRDCQLFSLKDFKSESADSEYLGSLGITPKMYFSKVVDLIGFAGPDSPDKLDQPNKLGVIVLERFGMSLKDLMRHYPTLFYLRETHIKDKTIQLTRKLFDMGYQNEDLHFGNILYDAGLNEVKLIDVRPEPIDQDEEQWHRIMRSLENEWEYSTNS